MDLDAYEYAMIVFAIIFAIDFIFFDHVLLDIIAKAILDATEILTGWIT